MKVVITGGTGFIGVTLARRLLAIGKLTAPDGRPAPIEEIVLFDMTVPDDKPRDLDGRVRMAKGEISDGTTVRALFDRPDTSVFHLASVVSGGGEQDFDLAMRVNLTGNLNVLEAARALGSRPRVVFASSIAVFGGTSMPKSVGDDTKQLPQTTYGVTKAIGELLINDYSRKGFIDGRSARLPTDIVRPGKPNKPHRASSAASSASRSTASNASCRSRPTPSCRLPVTAPWSRGSSDCTRWKHATSARTAR